MPLGDFFRPLLSTFSLLLTHLAQQWFKACGLKLSKSTMHVVWGDIGALLTIFEEKLCIKEIIDPKCYTYCCTIVSLWNLC